MTTEVYFVDQDFTVEFPVGSPGTTYTAGTGISIIANVIANTAPNTNQNLSLAGQALSISGGTGATLPVVGITAGTGIGVVAASGVVTVTNSAPNVVQALSIVGQDLSLSGGGGTVTIPSGGGGGTQNLQQVLTQGNTTETSITFDKFNAPLTVNGSGLNHNWLTFKPLVSASDGEPFFAGVGTTYFTATNKYNDVFMMGWNLVAGGGPNVLGKPGIGYSMEQRWRPGGGVDFTESHEFYLKPSDGTQVRLKSYTIDNTTESASLYHTVNQFSCRKSNALGDYFIAAGDTTGANFIIKTLAGSFQYELLTTGGNNILSMTSSRPGGGGHALFYNGFTYFGLGSIATIATPATFKFNIGGADEWRATPGEHAMYTNTAKPIRLLPFGTNALEAWADGTYYGVNMGGAIFGTISSARLTIAGQSATSADFSLKLHNSTGSSNDFCVRNDGRSAFGTNAPSTCAKVEIASTTSGFLPPRMTATERDAIGSPLPGVTIYCLNATATDGSTGVMQTWNGTTWKNNW